MNEDIFHLGIKGLMRNKKGDILLLRVNKKELIEEPVEYWDIPGGRIKKGQKIIPTLKNEIFEETGIQEIASFEHLTTVISNIRIPHQVGHSDVGLILSVYICRIIDQKKLK